ncbi:MAG: phage tail sheath subtilisin-like domain-containing protein [Sphingomonadales bacterium]|nr:phage tail sheath subtilisin-like domain-containing protein [Sphingomonadales bacterium]
MPEYLAPGVFVEEVSYRAKSIEGVSTTTTGFVGPTLYGPVTIEPEIITSLVEFERVYGGRSPLVFDDIGRTDNYMWNAVRAFFEEGGKRLYVARAFEYGYVDGDTAAQKKAKRDAMLSRVVSPFPPANVAIEARYPGRAGDARVRLQLFLSKNRYAFDGTRATLGSSGHRDVVAVKNVTIGGNDRTGRYTLIRDSQADTWTFDNGAGISFELQQIVGNANASVQTVTATVYVEPQADGLPFFAATELALDRGHSSGGKPDSLFDYFIAEPESPSAYRGNPIVIRALSVDEATAQLTAATDARDDAQDADDAAQDTLTAAEGVVDDAQTELDDAIADADAPPTAAQQTAIDDAQAALATANTALEARQQEKLATAAALTSAGLLVTQANALVADANDEVAQEGLRFFNAFRVAATTAQRFTDAELAANTGDTPLIDAVYFLTGGNDGNAPLVETYRGGTDTETELKHGLTAFEDVEDISIVAAPGSSFNGVAAQGVALALIAHAKKMQYRIAVIDSIKGDTISQVRDYRAKFDSTHAAFYYPWVRVIDPVTSLENHYPPSGFVAGIYARNDIERAVYKAPANEVVNLAIGFEKFLNKGQQEVLNPEGINCFRFFEGRGMRLWGARTMTSDPEWKYVNLRRYFAYLERSIDKGTQWAVFEPNGEKLWANVRRTISDFLLNEWQNGALLGEKPEKAYFVKCDRSTMTQNDLDNGRLICQIGVAPLRPAEFVIFRIGQWTADRKA